MYLTIATFGATAVGTLLLLMWITQIIYSCVRWVHDKPITTFTYTINETLDSALAWGLPNDAPMWFLATFFGAVLSAMAMFIWPAVIVGGCIFGLLHGLRGFFRFKTKVNNALNRK